ncbi:hypothetical protein MSG_03233 [Mycobacterium shigaense]|uniref:Uncharacterized protein n=1 Tax=Mycobacterium shigaense TaxID=722731 RepID=A0A1Z4EKA5_9MYCO|nr:hypothetical protein [Mycobacterium shigaense]PRI15955.1 hypothetical protein B2J96_07355 [Mycobacterium shigaense]BAX93371.1 hypothetical protein MSG_03233 [Mycobacterium shigaense]
MVELSLRAGQNGGRPSHRVQFSGDPDIDCSLAATLKDPEKAGVGGMTSGAGAMVATAMRVVNAAPYLAAAEPGLSSSVDLPLTIPLGRVCRLSPSLRG